MKTTAIYTLSVACILLVACTNNNNTSTEKYQNNRNNIVNVSDKIVDIKTDVIFGRCTFYILDSLLIINEHETNIDKQIHLFNINTFKYITSAGTRGQGPGEITWTGSIGVDAFDKILWVIDNGKQLMYKFPLDSVLNNPSYKPSESIKLNDNLFLDRYQFLNDSVVYGTSIHVINNNAAVEYMSKSNLKTNKTERYGYEHPKIVNSRANLSLFSLSKDHNMYVRAFCYCDLMTISNLDGSLKYNIYGSNAFDHIKHGDYNYYYGVSILDNYIITSYVNAVGLVQDKVRGLVGNLPTKFLVFDLDGNYIETIETGNKFTSFCVDQANHRIICYFEDRENPLGYFNFNLK